MDLGSCLGSCFPSRGPGAGVGTRKRLLEAARLGDEQEALRVLSLNPDLVSSTTFLHRKNILHVSVENGHAGVTATVLEMLMCQESRELSKGDLTPAHHGMASQAAALINAPDSQGRTALMIACLNNHAECARLLLSNGAWREPIDWGGNNAMHYASAKGHLGIMLMLTTEFLDELKTEQQMYLDEASRNGPQPADTPPPSLPDPSRFINVQNAGGFTPLHYAVWTKQSGAVQVLLQHGADLLQRNARAGSDTSIPCLAGSTPLHLAATRGHVEISRILLKTFFERVMEPMMLTTPDQAALQRALHNVDPRTQLNSLGLMPYKAAQRMGFMALATMLRPQIPLARLFNEDEHRARFYGPPALRLLAAEALNRKLLQALANVGGKAETPGAGAAANGAGSTATSPSPPPAAPPAAPPPPSPPPEGAVDLPPAPMAPPEVQALPERGSNGGAKSAEPATQPPAVVSTPSGHAHPPSMAQLPMLMEVGEEDEQGSGMASSVTITATSTSVARAPGNDGDISATLPGLPSTISTTLVHAHTAPIGSLSSVPAAAGASNGSAAPPATLIIPNRSRGSSGSDAPQSISPFAVASLAYPGGEDAAAAPPPAVPSAAGAANGSARSFVVAGVPSGASVSSPGSPPHASDGSLGGQRTAPGRPPAATRFTYSGTGTGGLLGVRGAPSRGAYTEGGSAHSGMLNYMRRQPPRIDRMFSTPVAGVALQDLAHLPPPALPPNVVVMHRGNSITVTAAQPMHSGGGAAMAPYMVLDALAGMVEDTALQHGRGGFPGCLPARGGAGAHVDDEDIEALAASLPGILLPPAAAADAGAPSTAGLDTSPSGHTFDFTSHTPAQYPSMELPGTPEASRGTGLSRPPGGNASGGGAMTVVRAVASSLSVLRRSMSSSHSQHGPPLSAGQAGGSSGGGLELMAVDGSGRLRGANPAAPRPPTPPPPQLDAAPVAAPGSASPAGVSAGGGLPGGQGVIPVVPLAAGALAVLGVDLGPDSEAGEECGVCLENSATVLVQPCRHAICGVCAHKMCSLHSHRTPYCPFCRAMIADFSPNPAAAPWQRASLAKA